MVNNLKKKKECLCICSSYELILSVTSTGLGFAECLLPASVERLAVLS